METIPFIITSKRIKYLGMNLYVVGITKKKKKSWVKSFGKKPIKIGTLHLSKVQSSVHKRNST